MQTIPYIPDSAPFTPEQRGWLNGFLAGLLTGAAPVAAAPAKASLRIAVLHASQSGTGEGLARKVAKELKAQGHVPAVASLEGYSPAALAQEQHAVLIASTYGEGDPPDAAKTFFRELMRADAPLLGHLSYSVLALGDRTYEHFCKFGADLDTRLSALGAKPIATRVECDVDVDEPFARWKKDLFARLEELATGDTAGPATAVAATLAAPLEEAVAVPLYSRENPLLAPLVEQRLLTCPTSTKQTVHLAFSLAEGGLTYEAGDALGVVAENDPALVAEVLDAARLTGGETVTLAKLPAMPIAEALTHHLQINKLTRKIVEAFAHATGSPTLMALLVAEQQAHLEDFCHGRDVLDLLLDYTGAIADAQTLGMLLPKLAPRLYSISSSPKAHAGEVHTTVAVVRYRSHNRERGGVCSTMLAGRRKTGDALPVYIQPNKRFRLPANADTPVIMIGPGTGIAPFRGFLHERRAIGAKGWNWLFFGDRSAATDFLYRDELEAMRDDGYLTRLDLAFSRDQERKIYVQDRMFEQGAEFWRWLQDGASVYVCGDASRMAKDVDAMLHTVVEQQGGLPKDAATEYVQQLKDEHRYHRDVY
jgi:sulfite reductase (NADPH) flavoprotein alpha-component